MVQRMRWVVRYVIYQRQVDHHERSLHQIQEAYLLIDSMLLPKCLKFCAYQMALLSPSFSEQVHLLLLNFGYLRLNRSNPMHLNRLQYSNRQK